MKYLLILIVAIVLISYKLEDFQKPLYENFANIKDEPGVKLTLPIINRITIGYGKYITSYIPIIDTIKSRYNIKDIINKNNSETIEMVNNNELEFGICQEDILYRYIQEHPNHHLKGVMSIIDEYMILFIDVYSPINEIYDLTKGYELRNKNYIIGVESIESESFYYLKRIMKANNIELYDYYGDKSAIKSNTLLYLNKDKNTLFNMFFSNFIDGIFMVTSLNDVYIKTMVLQRGIKFIPTDIEDKTNDNLLELLYNKTINISGFYDRFVSDDLLNVKASKIVFFTNIQQDTKKVYHFIKIIYENFLSIKEKMSRIQDTKFLSINYKDDFIPIEMSYLNKFIPYHKGALDYLVDIGFITYESNPKCMEFAGNKKCELDEDEIDVKKYYWKYNKIGLTEFN